LESQELLHWSAECLRHEIVVNQAEVVTALYRDFMSPSTQRASFFHAPATSTSLQMSQRT